MKRTLLIASLGMLALNSFAQNTFPSSGNVGVGTVSPSDLFHIYGSAQTGTIRIGGTNGSGNGRIFISADMVNNASYIDAYGDDAFKKLSINAAPLLLNRTGGGNVGIGTDAPESPLTVKNTSLYDIATFNSVSTGGYLTFKSADVTRAYLQYGITINGGGGGNYVLLTNADNGGNIALQTRTSGGVFNTSAFVVNSNGAVGIGTASPTERMEINELNSSHMMLKLNGAADKYTQLGYYEAGALKWNIYNDYATDKLAFGNSSGAQMVIEQNGNIGIGTTSPAEKLAVNGTIRSKEVKVETTAWPDYVFEDDYKLQKLEDVEVYLKMNKHLPGIPSAKEVEKEGINLGEMNARLLQKIEELTLHVIELSKQNTTQSQKNKELEKRVAELEAVKNK